MSETRKPAAFRLPPVQVPETEKPARPPRALKGAALAKVEIAEIDAFEAEDAALAPPPPAAPRRRRHWLAGLFLTSAGVLLSFAVGLWADRIVRDLFARAEWLGWVGLAMAVAAGLTLAIILLREAFALARLASVEKLRARAADAVARDDMKAARTLVDDVSRFVAARAETAAGRRSLAELRDDVIDGANLVRLAERELMTPLDAAAQKMILDAGKRVSIVTAVSPRALVDLFYVGFEAARLIRRLAELYGGRPGTLGFVRLARDVLAHLAVTGSIAAGDSLVQQLVGHGLAARLSAKLGEGVVNGAMTVRIGIAAMDTVRPLPFDAVRRPGMGDFLSALARFTASREAGETKPRE